MYPLSYVIIQLMLKFFKNKHILTHVFHILANISCDAQIEDFSNDALFLECKTYRSFIKHTWCIKIVLGDLIFS